MYPERSGNLFGRRTAIGAEHSVVGRVLGTSNDCGRSGGEVVRGTEPIHGRTSQVEHEARRIFTGLPNPLTATRYHSLIVPEATLPDCLRPTARTRDGVLMAFEHTDWPTFGVQFHPESVLTTGGHRLLLNFLDLAGITRPKPLESGDLDRLEMLVRQTSAPKDWEAVGPLHW